MTIDDVMYVVRNITIMSQPAARNFSAATAPSCGSEINPASISSTSIAPIRCETYFADACSCGKRFGNCGQYVPSPPATKPTLMVLLGRRAGMILCVETLTVMS